jgi:hypothetical protein
VYSGLLDNKRMYQLKERNGGKAIELGSYLVNFICDLSEE